jgi:hypothetical protein
MSPTVFLEGEYRFFFFSREETRAHIHIQGPDGEAKFWLEPIISLAGNYGLSAKRLTKIQRIIEEHKDEIKRGWKKHFKH